MAASEVEALRRQLEAVRDELASCREDLGEAYAMVAKAGLDWAQERQEKVQLQGRCAELEMQRAALVVERAELDAARAEAQERCRALEAEKLALQQLCKGLESSLQEQCADLESELEEARKDKIVAEERLREMACMQKASRQRCQELMSAQEELMSALEEAETERDELQEAVEEGLEEHLLSAGLSWLRESREEAVRESESLRAECDIWRQERDAARLESAALGKEIEKMVGKLEEERRFRKEAEERKEEVESIAVAVLRLAFEAQQGPDAEQGQRPGAEDLSVTVLQWLAGEKAEIQAEKDRLAEERDRLAVEKKAMELGHAWREYNVRVKLQEGHMEFLDRLAKLEELESMVQDRIRERGLLPLWAPQEACDISKAIVMLRQPTGSQEDAMGEEHLMADVEANMAANRAAQASCSVPPPHKRSIMYTWSGSSEDPGSPGHKQPHTFQGCFTEILVRPRQTSIFGLPNPVQVRRVPRAVPPARAKRLVQPSPRPAKKPPRSFRQRHKEDPCDSSDCASEASTPSSAAFTDDSREFPVRDFGDSSSSEDGRRCRRTGSRPKLERTSSAGSWSDSLSMFGDSPLQELPRIKGGHDRGPSRLAQPAACGQQ